MTILEMLIDYHVMLVELFVIAIVLNFIPLWIFGANQAKAIKWTRVGYFSFWGAWSMAFFAGLAPWATQNFKYDLTIYIMLFAILLLGFLDGYRSINLTKLWHNGNLGVGFSSKILALELVIIAITIVLAIKL